MLRSNELYTVRAKADPEDPASPYVMTSIPMVHLGLKPTRRQQHMTNVELLLCV